VSHTLLPSCLNLRDTVSPQIGLLRCLLGDDQSPLLPPKSRPINQTEVLTSLTGGALKWFSSLLWVPLCNWDLSSGTEGEASPYIVSAGLLAPGGMLSQWAGDAKSQQQGWKHCLQILDKPPVMLQESRTETWDTKAFQETIFISLLAAAQQIHIQRLSLKNKGVSPYIHLQANY
jgi:hypothetical protein